MRDERPLLQELLPADGAGVRHAAVHAAVVDELELARERHAAVRAHVRAQRAVEAAVHHQVLLRGTGSRTIQTNSRTKLQIEIQFLFDK